LFDFSSDNGVIKSCVISMPVDSFIFHVSYLPVTKININLHHA